MGELKVSPHRGAAVDNGNPIAQAPEGWRCDRNRPFRRQDRVSRRIHPPPGSSIRTTWTTSSRASYPASSKRPWSLVIS